MIIGIGVDIVSVERMEHWWNNKKLLERYFHEDELKKVRRLRSGSVLSLAARFAAKEAFGKALGTGMRKLVLKDIQVVNSYNGKPSIKLHGSALRALRAHKGSSVHLSLTHERESAVAMVIIEGD